MGIESNMGVSLGDGKSVSKVVESKLFVTPKSVSFDWSDPQSFKDYMNELKLLTSQLGQFKITKNEFELETGLDDVLNKLYSDYQLLRKPPEDCAIDEMAIFSLRENIRLMIERVNEASIDR